MAIATFPITLLESFMISPKVKHFVFSNNLTPAFDYHPGQFITIHFDHNDKSLKRSYSIANAPKQDNRIEFAAGFFNGGPGTELLYNLTPGDMIQINGPFGRLILKEQIPERYILVATSTGITPYRAMLPELSNRLKHNPQLQLVILLGVQKKNEVLYEEDFLNIMHQYPQQVLFKACLSKEETTNLGECEFKGYVQHAFSELNLQPEKDTVYLCGNPGMIDEAFNELKEQGFAMQHIIREKYISR